MNCPGQSQNDLFYFTLKNQPNYLDVYNSEHGGPAPTAIPDNSQFKCYDGMHNWNQLQPAPYDGMYQLPERDRPRSDHRQADRHELHGSAPPNHAVPTTDLYLRPPMLPRRQVRGRSRGPARLRTRQGRGQEHPDRRQLHRAGRRSSSPASATSSSCPTRRRSARTTTPTMRRIRPRTSARAAQRHRPRIVPEPIWPCVGEVRIVPDYISLFPQTQQSGAVRRRDSRLCATARK